MRGIPQQGETWKHWKGNKYVILAIAQDWEAYPHKQRQVVVYAKSFVPAFNELSRFGYLTVKDSETGKFYEAEYEDELTGGNGWVLYTSENAAINIFHAREHQVWVRELNNFMESTGNGYRFEQILAS